MSVISVSVFYIDYAGNVSVSASVNLPLHHKV